MEQLRAEIQLLKEELATHKRKKFGAGSERLKLLKPEDTPKPERKKRKPRKDTRAAVEQETERRHVPNEDRICECGCREWDRLSTTQSTVYESIPARMVQRTTIDETIECKQCHRRKTSATPVKVPGSDDYGASIIADTVVDKLADSIPLHRQARRYARLGLPIARSTLTDLFQLAGRELKPLWARLMEVVAQAALVQADETSMRVLAARKCRTAFFWVFLSAEAIAHQFSASRSGETPRKVLGPVGDDEEEKTLLTDAHSGYNAVAKLDGWKRAGCEAHGRRKFFDAHASAPEEAMHALLFFRAMYRIEHEAKRGGIKGTAEHLDLRRKKGLPLFRKFHRWLVAQKPLHNPKCGMGKAIRYALKNRRPWMRIFRDARIPLDNNASESALRIIVLLRKNAMFIGTDESGENHAILFSLIATCQLHGVNPREYLRDVLLRVQTHPASRIDELLPQNWKRAGAVEQPLRRAA